MRLNELYDINILYIIVGDEDLVTKEEAGTTSICLRSAEKSRLN